MFIDCNIIGEIFIMFYLIFNKIFRKFWRDVPTVLDFILIKIAFFKDFQCFLLCYFQCSDKIYCYFPLLVNKLKVIDELVFLSNEYSCLNIDKHYIKDLSSLYVLPMLCILYTPGFYENHLYTMIHFWSIKYLFRLHSRAILILVYRNFKALLVANSDCYSTILNLWSCCMMVFKVV